MTHVVDFTDVVDCAKALIQCPSVSPDDAGCQKIIAQWLASSGFTIQFMPFFDVTNLWAYHKPHQEQPMLVFAGHTDVVPPGNEKDWRHNPFTPHIEKNMLYGRGASDMKGGLAAMLVAAKRFVAIHPHYAGNIGFLITSDEEAVAQHGTKAVIKHLMEQNTSIGAVVIGEPSSSSHAGDTVRHGRRGSMTFTMRIEGIQGHVAYPHLARNPLHDAGRLINALSQYQWDTGTDDFPPSSLQIVNISGGGQATNVIPAHAEIVCNIRFSPMHTAESLLATMQQMIAQVHSVDGASLSKYVTLQHSVSGLPFFTSQQSPIAQAVKAAATSVCGKPPVFSTSGGTSDGRFIAPYGIDVVEVGASNATAHKVNECVSCDDLYKLVDIYQQIAERFFAVST